MSAIFKAEELFTKATVLVKTRQYPGARASLAKAMRAPPRGARVRRVGRLGALPRSPPIASASTPSCVAVMESALKKVPRCITAYLFLGQMAKMMGDLPAAERHLQRGLSLEPEDAELARELKYLRK